MGGCTSFYSKKQINKGDCRTKGLGIAVASPAEDHICHVYRCCRQRQSLTGIQSTEGATTICKQSQPGRRVKTEPHPTENTYFVNDEDVILVVSFLASARVAVTSLRSQLLCVFLRDPPLTAVVGCRTSGDGKTGIHFFVLIRAVKDTINLPTQYNECERRRGNDERVSIVYSSDLRVYGDQAVSYLWRGL